MKFGVFIYYNPTLILPYCRGDKKGFQLKIRSFSPVTGETQRG